MILVLATPRSGSSWFTSTYLSDIYPNYTDAGEPFNSHIYSIEQQTAALSSMLNGEHCIVKLFPQHLHNTAANTYNTLITVAEKIYVLVRKDFNAQLRSLYVAEQTEYFYRADRPIRSVQYNADSYKRNSEFLQTSYKILAQQWRRLDAPELVYLEDLPQSGKYRQPVTWDQEPPLIDFDTESLFT